MKLLITSDFTQEHIDILKSHFDEVKFAGWGVTGYLLKEDDLIKELQGVDVIIVGYEQITRRVIENTDLKLVSSIRGGPRANIDVDAATEKGVLVTFTVGRTKYAVADHTFALLLSLLRYICVTNSLLKQRVLTSKNEQQTAKDVAWTFEPRSPYATYRGPELHTLTMGLVGLGQIGQEVAKRAGGFSMKILAFDPYVKKETADRFNVTLVSLDELMKNADVVSIHTNVTRETKGMIGKKEIGLMKKTAVIINTARASVIDKDALYEALAAKRIGGAGLDVFYKEPLEPDDPLLDMDHVVLTPHIAGASKMITYHHSHMVTDDVLRFVRGERPLVVANPQVFKK